MLNWYFPLCASWPQLQVLLGPGLCSSVLSETMTESCKNSRCWTLTCWWHPQIQRWWSSVRWKTWLWRRARNILRSRSFTLFFIMSVFNENMFIARNAGLKVDIRLSFVSSLHVMPRLAIAGFFLCNISRDQRNLGGYFSFIFLPLGNFWNHAAKVACTHASL